MILWTLVGYHRHLDLYQFCYAVSYSAGETTSPCHDQTTYRSYGTDVLIRFVLHSSKGLVEVLEDENLTRQFTHESVRYHMLDGGLATIYPNLHAGRDVEAASHAILAEWCQQYLQSDWSKYIQFPVDPPRGWISDLRPMHNLNDFPLLDYTQRAIFGHIDAAYSGQEFELRYLTRFPLERWISFYNIHPTGFKERYIEPTASLIFLFLEHCVPSDSGIIKGILEYHSTYSAPCNLERKGTEILDSKAVFQTSLDNFCGGRYAFPLISAAWHGYTDCIHLMLECGATVNILDTSGCDLKHARNLDLSGHAEWVIAEEFDALLWFTDFVGHPLVAACVYHG